MHACVTSSSGNCNIDYHPDENPTYWAPEVIEYQGTYHMYLTYVPGIFDNWEHPRDIVHLTSKDGISWTTQTVLKLAVQKVIDACVIHLPNGNWRMWYNNEVDNKSIYYAESPDLYKWTDKGKVDLGTVGEGSRGNHADIEISNGHAYLFYFSSIPARLNMRGSAVYVQELIYNQDSTISCDPTAPCYINLGAKKR